MPIGGRQSSWLGWGIFMPSATKNRVTKKSRILITLAITSTLYGKVDMLTPAMSAPISLESPSQSAAPLTRKHQASAAINRSSGTLATKEKNAAARISADCQAS